MACGVTGPSYRWRVPDSLGSKRFSLHPPPMNRPLGQQISQAPLQICDNLQSRAPRRCSFRVAAQHNPMPPGPSRERSVVQHMLLTQIDQFELEQIQPVVETLMGLNPTPDPLAHPQLLYGPWRLLATDAFHVRMGRQNLQDVSLGRYPSCWIDVEHIVQSVEYAQQGWHYINHLTLFLLGVGPATMNWQAVVSLQEPTTFQLQFYEIDLYPAQGVCPVKWRCALGLGEHEPLHLQANINLQVSYDLVYLDPMMQIFKHGQGTTLWVPQRGQASCS